MTGLEKFPYKIRGVVGLKTIVCARDGVFLDVPPFFQIQEVDPGRHIRPVGGDLVSGFQKVLLALFGLRLSIQHLLVKTVYLFLTPVFRVLHQPRDDLPVFVFLRDIEKFFR